jgi:flagellar basal-body rod protein FlgF
MSAQAQAQDIISGNIAASTIPGYKKQDLSFSAVQAGLLSGSTPQADGANRSMLPKASPLTNFQQGDLKNTGLSTDLALEGKGFFEVQMPSGALAYTRDGEFQVNAQGQLTTKQGYVVLGDNGPIQLDRNSSAPIAVAASGEISQAGIPSGKLRIVDFSQPEALTQVGSGYYSARDPHAGPGDSLANVRQGFLEGANTSPANEMMNLISAMRAFEANQRLVQVEDERMGRVISELGNPN